MGRLQHIVLLCVFGLQSCAFSTPRAKLDAALEARIAATLQQKMHAAQIPGLAVGIITGGKVAYRRGFGVADINTRQPVTADTVFQLGSDSKMFVGIAMMQLKSQGKIDLDAPVTRYLPYFQLADARYRDITLRQILSHRSGMPYCVEDDACNKLDYQAPQFDAGALERHVREMASVKLLSTPGAAMQYSDIGFETIGDIIAKVSGESFEDYVQRHIFTPLAMQHSSFLLRDMPPAALASPHVADPALKVNDFFPYSRQHAPSSHLLSSVNDMNRFALAQLQRGKLDGVRILPASAYDTMWHPEIPTAIPSPWERTLGLGWFLGEHDGHRLVGHGGGDTGFACGFVMAPEDGLAVVVMINKQDSAEDMASDVMALLLAAEQAEGASR